MADNDKLDVGNCLLLKGRPGLLVNSLGDMLNGYGGSDLSVLVEVNRSWLTFPICRHFY